MKYINKYIILLTVIISWSCSNTSDDLPSPPEINNIVTFELTETDENNISEVDVLAFKVDANDNSKEYFSYRAIGANLEDNGAINKKKFTVRLLRGGSNKYRFVILVNSRREIDALGDINTSAIKNDVLERLVSHHTGKWLTNKTDANYSDIPMWAQTPQMYITDNTQNISDIFLIRMLARIDVNIDPAVQGSFKMKSVRVYNTNTYGQIAPKTTPDYWDGSEALRPTLPADPGKTLGPLLYDQMSVANISISKSIYVYEALAETTNSKATCLVIGGDYNNEGKESYYRYEFANTSNEGVVTRFNLTRNHLYNIKITSISGRGYDTPEEAFDAQSINITGEVTEWQQGGLSDVVFDGQYMLGVSKSHFVVPLNERTTPNKDNVLKITTDYPPGWVVEKIVDAEGNPATWLNVDKNSAAGNSITSVTILTQENATEIDRYGYIHIKAGRLKYVIEVLQTTIPELYLSIINNVGKEIDDLLFYSNVGGSVPAQQLTVEWTPQNSYPLVSTMPLVGVKSFDYGSGDRISPGYILDGTGIKTYNIQPPAMTQEEIDADPFLEKTTKIDITVTNNVSYESRVFFLTQKNYAAVPKIDVNFAMDGTEQYFIINANAPWEILVDNDPSNAIQALTTQRGGQYEDKRDEKVFFRTNNYTNNQSVTEATVTFRLKSTNAGRPFPDKTFTIKCYSGQILEKSNCYIVPPGTTSSRSYLIPVSRANDAIAGSIKTDDIIEPYFVWTDDRNHSTNLKLEAAGRGSSGYLYVYLPTGNPQGNTVVAARVNGVIKWSWHIWGVNYDPLSENITLNGTRVMGRNLGALNNGQGNKYSPGCHYQWGRKDPFPPPSGFDVNTNSTIYNRTGGTITMSTSNQSSLQYSVQNPLTYLISPSTWSGSAGNISWDNGGKKTIYDPCPKGWKVPATTVWSPLNTSNFAWNGTFKGRNHSTVGWFPAAGTRSRSNSVLINVGAYGGYWSGTYINPFIPTLSFNNTVVTYNADYYYIDGACVRCVEE